jgi:uncharacterized protein (TIGR02569 family)
MPSDAGTVDTPPDAHVLEQFALPQAPTPLARGTTGMCYRSGDTVLKPDQSEEVIAWLAGVADEVTPSPQFRLSRPIRSLSGCWTVSGWAALTFAEGSHERDGRWVEVLNAGRALHRAMQHLPKPGFLDARNDKWFLADRAAWGEMEIAAPQGLRAQIETLREMLEPVEAVNQVVHGDLCGNTLVHDRLPPAIIDVSAIFRPAEYAEGILVSDAVIWERAPVNLAQDWTMTEDRRQLLIRACLFRLYVAAVGWPDLPDRLTTISDHHAPLTDWLQGMARPWIP